MRLAIFSGILAITIASGVARSELVALWEFDFGTGTDSYGDNHAILTGDQNIVAGQAGKALECDGLDDFVYLDKKVVEGSFSFALWIRSNTPGNGGVRPVLVDEVQDTSSVRILWMDTRKLEVSIRGARPRLTRKKLISETVLSYNQWWHLAVTYDTSTDLLRFYVNGILDAEDANEPGGLATSRIGPAIIGARKRQAETRYFKGAIDDVCVFDHVLTANAVKRLYKHGGASFISNGYLAKLVRESETAVKTLEPLQAASFIDEKIAEHERWRVANTDEIRAFERHLPSDIYVLLARAREAAKAPTRDVVAAYKQAVSSPHRPLNYVPAALLWLFDKTTSREFIALARSCVYNSPNPCRDAYRIAEHFRSKNRWAAFKLFLDAASTEVNNISSYGRAIARNLAEDTSWSGKFQKYCQSKPEWTEYFFYEYDRTAQDHIIQKNFSEAAKVYQDVIQQCGPNQEKERYEMMMCECLLSERQYDTVIQSLGSFIENNRFADRASMGKAMLLRGQAYAQLGDINRATDIFLRLMVEYPESLQAPKASFFIGYGYMLQGRFDEATEAFNLLVKDYPESDYVDTACSYLTRMKNMTE